MPRIFILPIVFILFVFSFTNYTYAFNGERQGFILGIGGGPGVTSLSYDNPGIDRSNKFSFNTDFKIGYAPTNQLLIYWMSKVGWFSQKYYSESTIFLNGVAGLGLSYYLKQEGPSFYFNGGIGYSSYGAPFEEDLDAYYGVGIAAGAGYEFTKNWSIEGNLTWGNPDDEYFTLKTLGVKITLNWLGY